MSMVWAFSPRARRLAGGLAMLAATTALSSPARAQSAADVAELRSQIETLKAEQRAAAARIEQLEAALSRVTPAPAQSAAAPAAAPPAAASPVAAPVQTASAPASAPAAASRLAVSGDLRVRYEANFGDRDARNRDRSNVRARLRATYGINDWLTVGGMLSTGDPDDPNSADVTLSSFDDKFPFSLDQVYARMKFGDLQVTLGKIPQPFVRTDLVWDGDVSPQGASAAYRIGLPGGGAIKANALYFPIDESVAGPDSSMMGGQLAFETAASKLWRLELAAAYYDYRLRSLAGADAGDFRSNLISGGRYVSDFNLFDVIAAVTYGGFGPRWPVRLSGDYVHNFGARVSGDTGYGVDLQVGRASKPGDIRFGYGYAQTGVDAVLAAFSHDNTNLATNYRQHSLSVDYVTHPNVMLSATFAHYRPKDPLYAGSNEPMDWLDRARVMLLFSF